jgi:protoporphyrinogen oxidase
MFFEGYTEKVWGRHPRMISADWGAQRVKGLSIWSVIKNMFGKLLPGKKHEVETSLIEEFYYPKYGPGQLWEKALSIAQEKGARVVYGAKVTCIKREEGNSIAKVQCEDGTTYEADEVISSMPIKELVEAMQKGGGESVPESIVTIAQGLPYRDFVTVGLLVDRLTLKNNTKIKTLGNIVPDCWIYVQDTNVKLGRIQIFNNWSPYMLADPEHSVWIGLEYFCNEGDDLWRMSNEECVKFAIDELQKIGIIDHQTKIMDSCREKVKKAYPAYFDTYENMDEMVAYLNGVDNLYCVGRNGQHRYNNMDHSMVTAFVAADVIRGKANKEELWSVNTEKDYHESK